ncbi:putative Embryo defective 1273 [Cucumis melo var. makuwa]|uniref:Putative Embryo defective 1273 n=1 Tax=Cucumis melo var. makuwa TaxID=1194695 RepID=A0A5D3D973_CUCMM|nr:putative Embryo defective 1273 [Cucumis melo var. makuwa]
MALPASISLPSLSSTSRIILFKGKTTLNSCFPLNGGRRATLTSSVKVKMARFMDSNFMPIEIENLKEKMQKVVPEPVKIFPWKEAEKILVERLVFMGKETLKWSLLLFFVLSSFSDFVASIVRNQELLIPIGLFIGVLLTDLLKEISQEVFGNSEESSFKKQLYGIGSFFILVKLIVYGFAIQAQLFPLHVANGGLMQVLWLWRNLPKERNQPNEQSPFVGQGTS